MKTALFFRTTLVPLASCAVLLATSVPAFAAERYFLNLNGISGGSTDIDHKGWIDVSSFSWGVKQTASAGSGGGLGSGKAIFSDFTWEQGLDSSVTGLFSYISLGKHIPKAVVDFTTSGEKPFTYFKMTFDDAFLTSVDLSGDAGSKPVLDGAFSYSKVTLDYWAQKPDGSIGTHSSAFYDLKKGTGSASALASIFALGLIGPQVADPIPEPDSYAMLLAGLGVLGAIARRRKLV